MVEESTGLMCETPKHEPLGAEGRVEEWPQGRALTLPGGTPFDHPRQKSKKQQHPQVSRTREANQQKEGETTPK